MLGINFNSDVFRTTTTEALKHLIGKTITIAVTYIGSAKVFPVFINYIVSLTGQGTIPSENVVYTLLVVGTVYSIWQQGLMPWINGWFAKQGYGVTQGINTGMNIYTKIL